MKHVTNKSNLTIHRPAAAFNVTLASLCDCKLILGILAAGISQSGSLNGKHSKVPVSGPHYSCIFDTQLGSVYQAVTLR